MSRNGILIAGTATFFASALATNMYAKSAKTLSQLEQQDPTGCAFDRIANMYDSIIGSEERYMWYGLFRRWLLRKAEGNVLEISAGTGRNLPYYRYNNIQTLTLTDVSQPMLQQAQNKFFEDLQIQYKHPELTIKFLVANAENLVAKDERSAVTVPLRQHKYSSGNSSGSSSGSSSGGGTGDSAQQQQQQGTGSIWRFKRSQPQQQQQQQQEDSPGDSRSVASVAASAVVDHSSSSSSSSVGTAAAAGSPISTNNSSSSRWRWGRSRQHQQQQQPPGPTPGGCHHHGGGSSSSSSSSSEGSTFAPGSFDAVVDTFGLCSCDDPVQVLQQASRLLKPGGKLLLLEHGKSSWSWLNEYMDQRAPAHHKTYGCWYNRDIEDIVKKAGLEVESFSRWHFGTSYLIVATAPDKAEANPVEE